MVGLAQERESEQQQQQQQQRNNDDHGCLSMMIDGDNKEASPAHSRMHARTHTSLEYLLQTETQFTATPPTVATCGTNGTSTNGP